MRKTEAIRIIVKAANRYDKDLNNKNVLIIYGGLNVPNYIEIQFLPTHFLHLTGIIPNRIDNNRFYQMSVNNRLQEKDFEFRDTRTDLKLDVILQTLELNKNARMIGTYSNNSTHLVLQTEKLAGNPNSCMGFRKIENGLYVPNTVLKTDIRNEVESVQRVLAISSKSIFDRIYDIPNYIAKNVDYDRLVDTLRKMGTNLKLSKLNDNNNSDELVNNIGYNNDDDLLDLTEKHNDRS